jgi:hypothetical protein
MEVKKSARVLAVFDDDLPELDPVIAHEKTDYGWRGLTAHGEVLQVKSNGGEVPSEIVVALEGKAIGRRAVRNDLVLDIDQFLGHFNRAVDCYKDGRLEEALQESDATLQIAPALRAKFNRSMILLALGRWNEGFAEYWHCEQQQPFMRPQVRRALDRGLRPWLGESLTGKRLLVIHAHGFGDSIMMLRYLPTLYRLGARVVMDLPPELHRLAGQLGRCGSGDGADYFCPLLHLLHFIKVTPQDVDGRPYLLRGGAPAKNADKPRVGIAWSIGKPSLGDYPREIPLEQLIAALGDVELHSVQIQNADSAREFGVRVHDFADFAECAEAMMTMDAIVSVDTAALHLAGAIGHPRVFGVLSRWASWRWIAPWYDNVKLCQIGELDALFHRE